METKGSQFHYGSIKTYYKYFDEKKFRYCLNSTMVRLKQQNKELKNISYRDKSQFHYGSIKTLLKRRSI